MILVGDVRDKLREIAPKSIQTCVTSPPYWGLRNYGMSGQLGLESTPEEYTANLVEVFRLVRERLTDDGTLWLNLGDSYARPAGKGQHKPGSAGKQNYIIERGGGRAASQGIPPGLKDKDIVGIPWRVAFALQADGWYLRQDIIWSKPNPMPESVRDRCTKSHEYIFMLSKQAKYYYNADAIKNPPSPALLKQVAEGYNGQDTKAYATSGAQSASGTKTRIVENARAKIDKQSGHSRRHAGFNARWDNLTHEEQMALGSNKRSVWTVSPKPFRGAHFATFPPDLIEPCILAGSRPGDTVLDPFGGSGTTGMVADRHGRQYTLIELNPNYAAMAEKRIADDREIRRKALT